MGRGQGPSTTKDCCDQWIEHDTFSEVKEFFPSHKLKGNCTFAAQATTIRNNEAGEDPGEMPEGEGETEPSADQDVEVSGRIGEMDQSIEYIVHFAKAVKLYQKQKK